MTNGKYYIGQSIDVNYRIYEHKIGVDRDSAIDAAIKKYGKENFKFEVLERCNVEDLFDRERYWAEDVLDNMCYAPNGYNIDRTGRGRQRIHWVTQYDLEGNKIKSYRTPREAGMNVDASSVAIRQAIKNNGTCRGSMWRYGTEDTIDKYIPPKLGTAIKCYDNNGCLKHTFNNGVEAAKFFGISTAAISSYVTHKNGYLCCNGYYLSKDGEEPIIRDRIVPKKHTVKCYEYDVTSRRLINEYESIKSAANGKDLKSIRNALYGVQRVAYGSIWSPLKFDIIPANYREINKKLHNSLMNG